ncbi:hypothetical protein, partial [Pandoraea sputorum]|uniref:hypothetical protein n=1 Tax=Pandoraea sputorum TaxID=93222 RepID=UPI0035570D8A
MKLLNFEVCLSFSCLTVPEYTLMNLKFRHKILLAASGVVVLAFALFTLYNDYLQRTTIRQNLEA